MLRHGRLARKAILKKRWRMSFAFIRTEIKVNNKGRAENTESEFQAVGNIQPASAKALERLPEGDRTMDSISVHTPTFLTDGTDSLGADIVIYMGVRYLVKYVKPWGDYGFYHAVASLMRTRGVNA